VSCIFLHIYGFTSISPSPVSWFIISVLSILDIGVSMAYNYSNSVVVRNNYWLVSMVTIFIGFQIQWCGKRQWLSSVCCWFNTKMAEAI